MAQVKKNKPLEGDPRLSRQGTNLSRPRDEWLGAEMIFEVVTMRVDVPSLEMVVTKH